MFQLPTEPKSVWQVLGNNMLLYKSLLIRLLPFSLLYAILQFIPNLLAHTLVDHPRWWVAVVVGIVVGFITAWIFAALFHYGYHFMSKGDQSYGASCKLAFKRYFIYLLAMIIFMLLSTVGIILFVLPGIFIHVLLGFFLLCIMVENDGIIDSLLHSARLVWGNWWRVFFTLLLAFLLVVVICLAAELIIGIPIVFLSRAYPHAINWGGHLVAFLFILVFLPWFLGVELLIFHDLKLRFQSEER